MFVTVLWFSLNLLCVLHSSDSQKNHLGIHSFTLHQGFISGLFQSDAVLTPARITHCLCPHLWEMSMSQGRELISESERRLACTGYRDRQVGRVKESIRGKLETGGKDRSLEWWTRSKWEGMRAAMKGWTGERRKERCHYEALQWHQLGDLHLPLND